MTVPPARRAGLDRLLIGLLVLVHVTAVVSIVRQPWNVAPQAAARSVLWPLFHDAVHRLGPGADFFALVHGGVNTARGQSPYDAEEPPQRTPYFYHYRYLPGPAKTLGRALARLVPRAAYVLWVVVMEAALAGIAALLWRRLRAAGDGGAGRALGAVALLLLSTPYFLEAHMGQFTFVTMVLVTAALLLLEPAGAGLAAGIAAAALFALAAELKVFPLVAAPALLKVRRGWWGLAGAAALFLLLDLPAFHAAPRLYHQFVESNFADAPNGLDPGNHGLLYLVFLAGRAVNARWSAESLGRLALVWQLAVLGVTALLVFFSRAGVVTGGCVLLLAHFLSYVHVWEHHYSGVLVVGLALACGALTGPGGPAWSRLERRLACAALVMLALPTTFVFQDRLKDPWGDPAAGWSAVGFMLPPLCKTLPTLVLFALGLKVLVAAGFAWPARIGPFGRAQPAAQPAAKEW